MFEIRNTKIIPGDLASFGVKKHFGFQAFEFRICKL